MRIPGATGAVFGEYMRQAIGVIGQMLEWYRTVFNERNGLAVALEAHHDIQPGLADFPQIFLLLLVHQLDYRTGQSKITHQFNELLQLPHLPILAGTREFNQQDGIGCADQRFFNGRPEGRIAARQFDHCPVHQFDRHRFQFDDMLRKRHRLAELREIDYAQRLCLRQRRKLQRNLS
jgi:hypothetical protein